MNYDLLLQACDCAIVTAPASLYYLSGYDMSDAVILITKERSYYLTNPLYEVAVKGALRDGFETVILGRSEIVTFLREKAAFAKRIGVEYEHLTLAKLLAMIPDKETEDISPLIAAMRLVKRADEIAVIKEAESIVDRAYLDVLPLIKPGVTEKEIREAIRNGLLRYGADDTSFDTIVAFGENAAMPHAVPSDRPLREGDCVLMDFGAKYKGYCSDFTRTIHCGAPSEKFLAAYECVLSAQRAAIRYLESGGRSASEADRIARDVIDAGPFRGTFRHTLGHGVGIEIHEAPTLSEKSEETLSDNVVFTLEPGIYIEGEFGIRIESLVVLENGKLTVTDRSDKEIYIV